MKKTLATIKEAAQYAGIIAVSCLSALWLTLKSKRKNK